MFTVAHPDVESPTDRSRISNIVQGIRKKFRQVVKGRLAMTADIVKEVLQKTLDPALNYSPSLS